MSIKKSSDTIGNRPRDLPVCSAMPQTLRHRVPLKLNKRKYLQFMRFLNSPDSLATLYFPNAESTFSSKFEEEYDVLPKATKNHKRFCIT
jgi:hypothetical protein